ncbi:hypothetical protein M9H77_04623 [Catharanthus roseus]|uniref:Uncharacterized protein n=1 Tax=Catharanthus roseus TaxID=4058 RepID=A0ACC0CER2_CATRO|nr:hypothetical protein M9H77_04623 [Catharanthus roseus]
MVKVKNANVGRGENFEEGGSSRGGRIGKGKRLELGHHKGSSLSKKLLTLKNGQEKGERLLHITELIYLTWKMMKKNEGQEAMNVDGEESEEETFRREMSKRRGKNELKKLYKKNKRCTKGVSRAIYKEAKDHSRLQLYQEYMFKCEGKYMFYRKTGCPTFCSV